MIAARLANMKQGERTDIAEPSANLPKVDQATAARNLNVPSAWCATPRSSRTTPIRRWRLVDQGKMAVSLAAQASRLTADQQHEVVEKVECGRANVVRT